MLHWKVWFIIVIWIILYYSLSNIVLENLIHSSELVLPKWTKLICSIRQSDLFQ